MFDRAASSVIVIAAIGASSAMAVVATGFAIYALVEPHVGAPGAAAIVAGLSALTVGIYAWVMSARAKERERQQAVAQASLLDSLPLGLGNIARDHPIAAVLVSLLGGAVAARHPRLMSDLVHLFAKATDRT
ncbi:hypothetical protein U91I_02394 [alpha proteobacterium U9-1i]|nr:hypothetical protein U91I_02394 [alpha proteobacterium U9-1i]